MGEVQPAHRQKRRSLRAFPTRVGVCPFDIRHFRPRTSLPPTRGGLSLPTASSGSSSGSSPHAWGSVLRVVHVPHPAWVFPTRVGVSPPSTTVRCAPRRLPHTRGGPSCSTSSFSPNLPSSTPGRGLSHDEVIAESRSSGFRKLIGFHLRGSIASGSRSTGPGRPQYPHAWHVPFLHCPALPDHQQVHPDPNLPDIEHARPEPATQRKTSEATQLDTPGEGSPGRAGPSIHADWARNLQVRTQPPGASHPSALSIRNRCHQPFSLDVTTNAL